MEVSQYINQPLKRTGKKIDSVAHCIEYRYSIFYTIYICLIDKTEIDIYFMKKISFSCVVQYYRYWPVI